MLTGNMRKYRTVKSENVRALLLTEMLKSPVTGLRPIDCIGKQKIKISPTELCEHIVLLRPLSTFGNSQRKNIF